MAQHPARQLNSKSIRDAAISYLIPEVQGKFCVVSATCVWRVEEKPASLAKAWELVCEKRTECNNAVEALAGVAFFFSAITTSESSTKTKGKKAVDESEQSLEDDDVDIPCSQPSNHEEISTSSAINSAIQKGRLPTIVYWIAMESPNGAPVSLVQLQRNLLKCDVEIDTKVLSHRPGTSAPRHTTKRLCATLKDHNSTYISEIVNFSFEKCLNDLTDNLNLELEDSREYLDEHVVRFIVLHAPNPQRLRTAIDALIKAGLQMDVIGLEDAINKPAAFVHMTSDICTQLINDIEAIMGQLGYALYQGMVYKKNPKATFTYTYKCDVNSFIGALEGNEAFKSRLLKYGERLRDKLKNPKSQLIQQLEVDHDLIEVNDGWCLSIEKRGFVKVCTIFVRSKGSSF